jgi:excisionase family DNA binding protein
MREAEGYRDNLELIADFFPKRLALSVDETAEACGVSTKTVRRWIDSGKLNAKQQSGSKKIVIPVQSVARYLAGK